jgi:hypothetical protein
MRAMQIRSLAALALLAVVPAACTAMSTYPPVDGKVVNTPSVSPGPEVMAGAIKEAHRLTAPNTDIIFNLPAGLPENTWNRVAFLLPDSARAMEPGDENVYSVKQLRIQGGSAEVDVIYPERGVYQLMTVKFSMDRRVVLPLADSVGEAHPQRPAAEARDSRGRGNRSRRRRQHQVTPAVHGTCRAPYGTSRTWRRRRGGCWACR